MRQAWLDPKDALNPRGMIAKQLEMCVRRGATLAELIVLYSVRVGADEARRTPWARTWPEEEKLAIAATGLKEWWRSPIFRQPGWTIAWDLWAIGADVRGVNVILTMLPGPNIDRIEKEAIANAKARK